MIKYVAIMKNKTGSKPKIGGHSWVCTDCVIVVHTEKVQKLADTDDDDDDTQRVARIKAATEGHVCS